MSGLLLRDGDEAKRPFPENPWDLDDEMDLDEAIYAVWEPVIHRARDFVEGLLERVLGLVLLHRDSEVALGYLIYHERDDAPASGRPPFDRRHAMAWERFGDLTMFVGNAPAPRPCPPFGIVVPPSLRELYAIHDGMFDGTWSLAEAQQLMLWSRMLDHTTPTIVRSDAEGEVIRSDHLLYFFSYGDDRSDVFDLSSGIGEPQVRTWGEGHLYGSDETPFWAWFAERKALFLEIAD